MELKRGFDPRWLAAFVTVLIACGRSDSPATPGGEPTVPPTTGVSENGMPPDGSKAATDENKTCADVVDVAVAGGDGIFSFDVTVSSGDTGWEKYADAWEVRGPDGAVLGVRVLTHPHETEQPFTRSLTGVEIPEDVVEVTVAARDSVLGFCGDAMTVAVR